MVNFSDFSSFPHHVGRDYRRSCCLAMKKILFYHESCSLFLFSAAVLHSFPDSRSSLEFRKRLKPAAFPGSLPIPDPVDKQTLGYSDAKRAGWMDGLSDEE